MLREFQGWLASAIHAERAARGMTVKALAQQSVVAERVLIRALQCERDMNAEQLARIAAALGKQPSYLILEAERRRGMATPAEKAAMVINSDSSLSAKERATLLTSTEALLGPVPSDDAGQDDDTTDTGQHTG